MFRAGKNNHKKALDKAAGASLPDYPRRRIRERA
jgi:hypothetical protein